MTERSTRPLSDGSSDLPCTIPTAALDLQSALGKAIEIARYEDGHEFGQAAVIYAFACQRRALGALAIKVRDGEAAPAASGWALTTGVTNQPPYVINMLLHHPDHHGAHLIQVQFNAVMTDEASAALQAAEDASGLSFMDQILSPTEEMKAIQNDRASYRPAHATSSVQRVTLRAIDMGSDPAYGKGGKPHGHKDADPVSDLWPKPPLVNEYSSGRFAEMKNPEKYDFDGDNTHSLEFDRFFDVLVFPMMERLQDIVAANGLAHMLPEDAERISKQSWVQYGREHQAQIAEAGFAAVHAESGCINSRIPELASRIARAAHERNLRNHADEIETMIEGLRADGIGRREDAFETSYERAWLEDRDGEEILCVDTQNGLFHISWGERTEIQHEGAGLLGRFKMRRDGAITDGDFDAEADFMVSYEPQHLRSLNFISNQLASVAFCYGEEHGPKAARP